MLRGGPGQAADAVRTADGRLTANVEEMDEVLQEAWDPILRMYGEGRPEPEYEVFRRAFEGFIPRRQMDLRDGSYGMYSTSGRRRLRRVGWTAGVWTN
ncbi:hypothetical protein DIPPA_25119 [Diplonema papillatum]|nr:hypothetical protein DIPPA_25119 [Diplonema papillatum]